MKCLSLFLVAALAASTVSAQDWAKARIEKSSRHLEWVTVKHDTREVGSYIGFPEVKNKAPAVIVIHEIFGLSDWARLMVDELAEAGYIAIAPDLLWGTGPKGGGTSELAADQVGLKIRGLNADQITADLTACVDYVKKLDACNGKVVVIGFCYGGGQSLRFASNNKDLKAAFVCYGNDAKEADFISRIGCPVYGFYGGNDLRVTGTTDKTKELMKAADKAYEVNVYEGAGHGFMRSGDAPPPQAPKATGDETADKKGQDAFAKAKIDYPNNVKARDQAWARIKEVIGKL
jgi:carboxymethylenebutenolidase